MTDSNLKHKKLLVLGYTLFFSVIFSVLVKPISGVFFNKTLVKYSLVEDFEKNESSESEFKMELEDLFKINFVYTGSDLSFKPVIGFFFTQSNKLNFVAEIQLPPPKV